MIAVTGKLGHATFSDDREHRFLVTRGDLSGRRIALCMLNPSKASHEDKDRTVDTKVVVFAERIRQEHGWPTVGVLIVNLYAVRATDPDDCFAHPRPIGGEENDRAIILACTSVDLVICAWGSDARAARRAMEVRRLLTGAGVSLHRFAPPRLMKTGRYNYPAHPLYIRNDTPIEEWR